MCVRVCVCVLIPEAGMRALLTVRSVCVCECVQCVCACVCSGVYACVTNTRVRGCEGESVPLSFFDGYCSTIQGLLSGCVSHDP